jgi:rhodanese-related sulfurtransferase
MVFVFIIMPIYGQNKTISEPFKKEIDSYLAFTVPTISINQLVEEQEKYLLLDAREEEEYKVSHIPEAKYVGYDFFNLSKINDLDKTKPVVVYCSIGYRSEKIGERLLQAGFQKVYNLYGSIFAWANAGLPMEDESGKTTNRIHGYNQSWSRWITSNQLKIVY